MASPHHCTVSVEISGKKPEPEQPGEPMMPPLNF
jgi:hypothetical protein